MGWQKISYAVVLDYPQNRMTSPNSTIKTSVYLCEYSCSHPEKVCG